MSVLGMLLQEPWVERAGWALVHFLWQGTMIAVLFTVVRGLAGRRMPAHGRYLLACGTLGAMTLAVPVTFVASGWVDAASVAEPLWRLSVGATWDRVLPWLVVAWVAGVLVFSVRLIGGWRLTARLRAVAVGPVPEAWLRALEELVGSMRVSAPVRLLGSSLVVVPTVVGWLRPVILMPVEAMTGMSLDAGQVRALLAHELAHIRRHDYLVNIVQSVVEVVLFYHPAVWWVSDQIREEREACCDDAAVAASGDVLLYARALAELETQRRVQWQAAVAADGGSLVKRIRRLAGMSQPLSHELPGPGAAWALSLLWAAGIGAVAMHGAPERSFQPVLEELVVRSGERLVLPEPPVVERGAPVMSALLFDPFVARPQGPGRPEVKKARVEGRVLSTSGEALKRATVRLEKVGAALGQMPLSYTAETDDAGQFEIDEVEPGGYRITASRMGYVDSRQAGYLTGVEPMTVTLRAGAVVRNQEIRLPPQGIVGGRATYEDGEPVVRGQVSLLRVGYGRKGKELRGGSRGQTNDQGEFVIGQLPAGKYYLSVNPGQRRGGAPGANIADRRTFYPRARSAETAVAIEVRPGDRQEGLQIKLLREPVYSVSGKVTLNGGPAPDTLLALTGAEGGSVIAGTASLTSTRNGEFRLNGLGPGAYVLRVMPGGSFASGMQLELGLSGKTEVTVTDGNVEGVVMALTPGIELAGTVKFEDGPWSGAAEGTARPAVGLAGDEGFEQSTPSMPIQDDGTFQLLPMGSGRYRLNVSGLPAGTYVKSVRYGGQDVTESPLNLAAGGGSLDVVLSRKGAAVSGILRNKDGEALRGVQVTVWPKRLNAGSESGGIEVRATDQNGQFRVEGLAPGDYYVAAWEEAEGGLAASPPFLKSLTSQATAVTVEEGARVDVEAKLISRERIAAAAAVVP